MISRGVYFDFLAKYEHFLRIAKLKILYHNENGKVIKVGVK